MKHLLTGSFVLMLLLLLASVATVNVNAESRTPKSKTTKSPSRFCDPVQCDKDSRGSGGKCISDMCVYL
jgi:hypothetical protein